MAQSEAIELRSQAKQMGIDGYRRMSLDELRRAVSSGGSKRKSASGNSTGSKRKSAAVVAQATGTKRGGTKRKTGTTVPAAKSTTGKAKRPSTAGTSERVTCHAQGCRRKAPARGRYAGYCDEHRDQKDATASRGGPKRKSARGGPKTTPARGSAPGRNPIDGKSVDWSRPWGGGKKGNRGEIFKLLRKHKGNKQKVFDALTDNALKMYPRNQRTGERYKKADALKLLRWHIGRIAFDYVMASGQHEISANRAGYGESQAANNVSRRKTTGGRQKTGAPKSGRKSAKASGSRQTASQGRKRTTTAKAKNGRRKTAGRKRK